MNIIDAAKALKERRLVTRGKLHGVLSARKEPPHEIFTGSWLDRWVPTLEDILADDYEVVE